MVTSFLSALERNRMRLTTHFMWDKFLYYAGAIRCIEATTASVSPGTISLLTQLLPQYDPILFPSLRYLSWTETFPESNDLFYMLSPMLEELQLGFYDFYDSVSTTFMFSEWAARLFHAASHLCPNIRFLTTGGIGPVVSSSAAINYFDSLHRFTITQRAFDCK